MLIYLNTIPNIHTETVKRDEAHARKKEQKEIPGIFCS